MPRKVTKKMAKKKITTKKQLKQRATKLNDLYVSIGGKRFPLEPNTIENMVDMAIETLYENEDVSDEIDALIISKVMAAIKNTDFLKNKAIKTKMLKQVENTLNDIFEESVYLPQVTKDRIAIMKASIIEELTDKELKTIMKKKLLDL